MRAIMKMTVAAAVLLTPGLAGPAEASRKCELARELGDAEAIARYCRRDDRGEREEIGSPRGSFVESCKNTRQDGWVVSALCLNKRGEWSRTSTNFKTCPNFSLTNVNGNLVCGP